MIKVLRSTVLGLVLLLLSCSASIADSAILSVDFPGQLGRHVVELTIANGDFDLRLLEVSKIDSKEVVGRQLSLTDEASETYGLYEIRMRYTNRMDKVGRLAFQDLWISLPGLEDPGESVLLIAYCEPRGQDPTGPATFCAQIPAALEPGVYGVVGVFQSTTLEVQPGAEAAYSLVVAVDNAQPEIEIYFVEALPAENE
ncbi:MAG TPA: hypothetical protein VIH14_02720 [Anaerolineales bacterium]